MRFYTLLSIVLLSISLPPSWLPPSWAEEPPQTVTLATHTNTLPHVLRGADAQALERIRKIVLNHDDDSRALANLVQLARDLPTADAAQLYADLADDYLERGKYDQAANLLQQLLNQHAAQTVAGPALVKLLRLYSSSEVNHTQTPLASSNSKAKVGQDGFLRYAQHLAESTLQKHPSLANNPALDFQCAVIARSSGRPQAAQGWLTKLKHNSQAGPWRTCALVEKWLQENTLEDQHKNKTTKSIVLCHRAGQLPHLDGTLDEALWQSDESVSDESVRLAYDHEFLYLALRYPKIAGLTYETDKRPRTHDADLSAHDHVRLRLDLDRDYATCFELSIDHRGWTRDRCWLATDWNPRWFVAANQDATHWTAEAAIPWEQLTRKPPQPGNAWTVAWDRIVPQATKTKTPSPKADFSLLLFE